MKKIIILIVLFILMVNPLKTYSKILPTNVYKSGIYKVTKEPSPTSIEEGDYGLKSLSKNSTGYLIILDINGEVRLTRRFEALDNPDLVTKSYFKLKEGEQVVLLGQGEFYLEPLIKGIDY